MDKFICFNLRASAETKVLTKSGSYFQASSETKVSYTLLYHLVVIKEKFGYNIKIFLGLCGDGAMWVYPKIDTIPYR